MDLSSILVYISTFGLFGRRVNDDSSMDWMNAIGWTRLCASLAFCFVLFSFCFSLCILLQLEEVMRGGVESAENVLEGEWERLTGAS